MTGDPRIAKLSPPAGSPPCNGCTECCHRDWIFLKPELGDRLEDYAGHYDTHENGKVTLKHKANGDCIYMVRGVGCSTWNNRPVVCRGFDCRTLWLARKSLPRELVRGQVRKEVLMRGKVMYERGRFK